jgi:hypothetical protein
VSHFFDFSFLATGAHDSRVCSVEVFSLEVFAKLFFPSFLQKPIAPANGFGVWPNSYGQV